MQNDNFRAITDALVDSGIRAVTAMIQNGKQAQAVAALTRLEEGVRPEPESIAFQRTLADFLHVALDRKAEALAIYERIAAARPDQIETGMLAGHLNVALGRFDQARHWYQHVMRAAPWDSEAQRYLDALQRHLESDQGKRESGPDLHSQARQAMDRGDEAGALVLLKQLATVEPDNPAVHADLGMLLHRRGHFDRAGVHFQRAVELAPREPGYLRSLADFTYGVARQADQALEYYRRLSQMTPRDVEALLIAGHICVSLERLDEAEDFYCRVLAVDPQHVEAQKYSQALARHRAGMGPEAEVLYRQAIEAAEAGDATGALDLLEKLVAAHPEHAAAHNDLGVLHYRAGDMDRAAQHYARAAALAPAEPLYRKNLADFLSVARGKVQEALEIYVDLLAADPYDVEALLACGRICQAMEQPRDARHFFERALEAEPWNADARTLIEALDSIGSPAVEASADDTLETARRMAEAGDAAGALDLLQKLVAAYPEHAAAYNDLGVLHYRAGDMDRAEQHYARAAALAPAETLYRKNLADFYAVVRGRTQAALEIYVDLLAADPYDVEALLACGRICQAMEKPGDARHFFERALEAEPWNADARTLIEALDSNGPPAVEASADDTLETARRMAEAGDLAGALDLLEKLVAAHPEHAAAHNDLGVLHYRAGDMDRAEQHYARAAALAPAETLYRKNLADFYAVVRGRTREALEIYVDLLAEDPYDVEALLACGRICQAMEKPGDARHFFERALEAEPWNADARQLLQGLDQTPGQVAAG